MRIFSMSYAESVDGGPSHVRDLRSEIGIVVDVEVIARPRRPIFRASLTRFIERYHVPDASKRKSRAFYRESPRAEGRHIYSIDLFDRRKSRNFYRILDLILRCCNTRCSNTPRFIFASYVNRECYMYNIIYI